MIVITVTEIIGVFIILSLLLWLLLLLISKLIDLIKYIKEGKKEMSNKSTIVHSGYKLGYILMILGKKNKARKEKQKRERKARKGGK